MSNLLRKLTSRGLSFSHLAKVDPHAADDTPPADDDNNKDGKKGKKAADDGPDDQNRDDGDSSGKKGKKAADDSGDPDDDSEEGKKGQKAAAGDPDPDAEDDDDEEEMRGNSASAQARRRERARCASIMGSQHAGRNPVLAANLAFTSTMSRKEAIAILKDTPTSAAAAPPVRKNPALGTGGDATVTSGQAIASSWDRAMQKARSGSGKKR